MSEMYKIIEDFCSQRKTNITQMCRDLNIPRSALSELKAGRTQQLSLKYATKIADYFGVSTDYLLGRNEETTKKAPALTKKDERDIAKMMEQMQDSLKDGENLMFDGDPMDEETADYILKAIETGLRTAKVINKEKYNPRKNQKKE